MSGFSQYFHVIMWLFYLKIEQPFTPKSIPCIFLKNARAFLSQTLDKVILFYMPVKGDNLSLLKKAILFYYLPCLSL